MVFGVARKVMCMRRAMLMCVVALAGVMGGCHWFDANETENLAEQLKGTPELISGYNPPWDYQWDEHHYGPATRAGTGGATQKKDDPQ